MSLNETVDSNKFQGSTAHYGPGQEGRQVVVSSNHPVDLNTLQGLLPSASTQGTLSSDPNRAGSQWNYQEAPHTPTDKSPPGTYNTPSGAGHPTEACNSPLTPSPVWHFPQTSNTTRPIDLQGRQIEQTCRSPNSNVFQSFYSSASTQAMSPGDPNSYIGGDTPTANPQEARLMGWGRVANSAIGSNVFHRLPPPTSIQVPLSSNPNHSVSQLDYHPGAAASAAPSCADNTPSTPAEPTPRDPIACTRCGWEDEDGIACGHTIDSECQRHFADVHGIINLPAYAIVSCRWCKPDYKMRRDGFLRHIREAHLSIPRSKRGRVDRRLALA
ncbi:hypothetical protein SCLCIDRAFT_33337 [Scleroderma citrinum Foug A]|uniref:Uncharacterized protein n=1 Tax=Scleroderma citrinum Foug A TaxID=1036808 RepID=A0A0C2YPB1_9AGAM|nr:hypothetical protein SCLCIDRAFT_33337 [Scleroderma citrinum Foug A]